MTTKNYEEAVEAATTLYEHEKEIGNLPERLMAIGYVAALADANILLKDTSRAAGYSDGSSRFFAIARDKMSALVYKLNNRLKELKI